MQNFNYPPPPSAAEYNSAGRWKHQIIFSRRFMAAVLAFSSLWAFELVKTTQNRAYAQGGNNNTSGWEKQGNQVRLIDSASMVNVGNHLATERLDVNGNLRVREMTDLPQNNAANAQLKFRSIFADNTGKFYKGPERELPRLPIELPDPALNPGGNAATNLWQPNGTSVVWTNRKVGIGLNSPTAALEVNGVIKSGNSIWIDGIGASNSGVNSIFATDSKLSLLSGTPASPVTGLVKVGIGTNNPQKALHIKTEHTNSLSPCIPHCLQYPVPPDCLKDLAPPPTGTHYGLRLEDQTNFTVCTSTISSLNTIWDIEPILGTLIFSSVHTQATETISTPRMMITSGGSVGIGTTQPSSTLSISGNADISGRVGIGTTDPGSPLDVLGQLSIGGSSGMASERVQFYYDAPLARVRLNAVPFKTTDPGSVNSLSFGTAAGPDQMVIDQNGKVGIGTTNPPAKLTINNADNNTEGLEVKNGDVSLLLYENNSDGTNAGAIQVKAGGSSTTVGTTNYRLALQPDGGNVGIGTTNPQAKLHVDVANDNDVAFAVYKGSTEQFRIMGDGIYYGRGYRIKLGNFPDYVFNKAHKRMTFEERALYYLKYERMPMLPSAEEAEEGLDVGNTLIGLTFNMEEIALNQNDLYKMIIEQKREIELLKREMVLLKINE